MVIKDRVMKILVSIEILKVKIKKILISVKLKKQKTEIYINI